ncbi:leucine-rich repeat domain-containing protein [Psychromonas ossibalaenae]|uniref:leucine-rich repeat domain-containing protein n=1 Tax=Psychromonas ossibalaenae TaxID=444922 RepID=UPI0003699D0F|nr:leucine-rich repeat domain-containing protein [Psychromonas ossibalaenae]
MKYYKILILLGFIAVSYSYADEEAAKHRVTNITMSGKSLKAFPTVICNVGNLRELHLGSNSIEIIPPCLSKHSITLTNLDLSGNSIKILPKMVGKLQALSVLDLRQNALGTLPDEIGELIYLESLYLSHNPIKTFPMSMSKLIYLEHLDLSSTQIEIIPDFLPYLVSLKTLDLTGNSGLSNAERELIRKILPGVEIRF